MLPERGRRHLAPGRARAQASGHRRPHRHAGRRRRGAARAASASRYGEESAEVDYLVIAAGRGADVEGLGLDRGRRRARRSRPDRGRRRACAPRAPASTRSATSCAGPALAHKASDEGIIAAEDIAGLRDPPDRLRRHPARHLLHPQRRLLRAHRGAGPRAGLRRGRRQGPLRRGRRRHRLRRPHRPGEDRRRVASTASCSAATSSARAPPS